MGKFAGMTAASGLAIALMSWGCAGESPINTEAKSKAGAQANAAAPPSTPAPSPSQAPGSAAPNASETPKVKREELTEPSKRTVPQASTPHPGIVGSTPGGVSIQLASAATIRAKGEADPAVPKSKDYLFQASKAELIQDKPYTLTPPAGLPPVFATITIPAANPLTEGKIALGKQLYFDPRVSKDSTVSCATCHNPEKGWTDNLPTSTGIGGQVGGRNSPTVLNTVYGRTMFWDGRADSLEAQAQGPVQNPIEMGDQTYETIITRLRAIPGYQSQFQKVFGTDVTLDGMAKAIASFERVAALSGNSRYDQYARGKIDALNDSEKRGMVLFGLDLRPDETYPLPANVTRQKARCTICHVGGNFTDEKFHNLGVGWDPSKNEFKDLGRWAAVAIGAKSDADIGAFKTPTLRDISKTGPYMHDGGEATLEGVMELYNKGGHANPHLDKEMKPLKLNPEELQDVVAFMKALDGQPTVVELPALPPGPDGNAPNPKAALTPPAKKTASATHLPIR